jgi:outer membrane receptor protein involved in Fe transport
MRLTEGIAFAGGRGHFIFSGESSDNNGIRGVPRSWNNTGAQIINNPAYTATNGLPQFLNARSVGAYTTAFGGVIDSTALAGTAFGPGGTPHLLNLGTIQQSPYEVGGDWQSLQWNQLNSLDPSLVSNRVFTRMSYAISDNFDVYAQYSWAGTRAFNVNEPIFYVGNLTIKSDNAFIPASVLTRVAALKITSFTFGTLNGDLPPWQNSNYRQTRRAVVGADGKFDAFGDEWAWSAYYQDGKTFSFFKDPGDLNVTNYMKAIDAVVNPATNGIVCRTTLTAPTNGCVPLNLFGTGVNNQAAINYVEGAGQFAFQKLNLEESVISAQLNGDPFSTWAGTVSVSTGIEHRVQSVNTLSDPLTGQWYGANYTPVSGHYTVTEGFVEAVVPLAKDAWFAKKLDMDAAIRATGYSLAGFVDTWKFGFTWDVIPDLRIRGNRSRDIRAPNLAELFQTGAGGTNTARDDFHNNNQVLNTGVTQGNVNLKPETSDSTGLGVVFQPTFLDNFSASVDYWEDDIKQAITSIGGQQVIDLCFQGLTQYCSAMTPNLSKLSATPTAITIITQPVNLASQTAEGLDFEASYAFPVSDIISGAGGNVAMRYVGTHNITNTTNNKLTPPNQIVGAALAKWRHNLTVTYSGDPFTVSLTGRVTSAGVLNLGNFSYVRCTAGCPASTTTAPTIDDNHIPGSFYLDTSINYNFEGPYSSAMQIYFNVQNLFNLAPGITPSPLAFVPSIQTQTTGQYDLLGRTFRLGVRFGL